VYRPFSYLKGLLLREGRRGRTGGKAKGRERGKDREKEGREG